MRFHLNRHLHFEVDSKGNHIGGGKRRWGHCDVEACREEEANQIKKASSFDENDRMCFTVGRRTL